MTKGYVFIRCPRTLTLSVKDSSPLSFRCTSAMCARVLNIKQWRVSVCYCYEFTTGCVIFYKYIQIVIINERCRVQFVRVRRKHRLYSLLELLLYYTIIYTIQYGVYRHIENDDLLYYRKDRF